MKRPSLALLALLTVAAPAQERAGLQQMLQSAYAARPGIEAARLRVAEARAQARLLGAYPSTELSLGITSPPEAGGSDDDFVLSQELDFFGRARAGKARGYALVLGEQARLRAVILEVQSQVLEAYGEAAASELRAEVAKRILETAAALYDSSQKRFEEGRVPEVQVIRSRIEHQRALQDFNRRSGELQAARTRLAQLTGLDNFAADTQELSRQVNLAGGDLGAARPELAELAAAQSLASAEAEQVRAEYRPTFAIQGRRSAWNDGDGQFGLRLQLTIPLLDHGRRRAELEAVDARRAAVEKQYADALLLAKAEVAAAEITLKTTREQAEAYRLILDEARTLVAKSQLGYEEGATTLIEVLEATRAMREVEEGYVEALAASYAAQADYIRATGQLLEETNA